MKDEMYFDKLAKELTDRIGEGLKDQIKEVKEENAETVAKLKEQNEVIAAKIEAIENMPAEKTKISVDVPGKDKKVSFYKGYDLKKQGENLSIAPKFMVTEEDREIASKFIVDVVTGKATNVEGTGSRGGYLVPEEFSDILMAHAKLNSIALNEAMVIPMAGDVIRIPKESSGVSVTWSEEEGDLGEANGTYGEIVLQAKRLGCFGIISNELLADSQFDITSIITAQIAESIGQELDDSMFNGGGGSTFTGALSGATNTVTCAATGTSPSRHVQLTNDELSQCLMALTDNKLMGSKFYFHQNSMHSVRTMTDDNGRPIFAMPGNGVPGTVYEYPYVVSQKVGAAAPGAATPFALFGNLKKCYVIGQRKGNMVLDWDAYGLFTTFRSRYRMVTRFDGAVALGDGLVKIVTHA